MGGHGRPKWEVVGGRGGRPWEAEVGGGRGRLRVGGHGRPNLGSLIGSDRSHDKMWQAEAVGGHGGRGCGCGRPKVGGRGRPCSPDWLR